MIYVYIGLGGFAGAGLRYVLSNLSANILGPGYPWGTLLVNLMGCLGLGAFLVLSTEYLNFSPGLRLGIATGFFGSLTTFSTFIFEGLMLFQKGLYLSGVSYLLGSTLLGLILTFLGRNLAKGLAGFIGRLRERLSEEV